MVCWNCFLEWLAISIQNKKERSVAEKTSKPGKKPPLVLSKEKKKENAPKTAPVPKASSQVLPKKSKQHPAEDRYRLVAETAYFIAERRGFSNGSCEDDWYEAERRVSSLFP